MGSDDREAPRAVGLSTAGTGVGSAPPVADAVDSDRIRVARSTEPHNWLTYYGAYDGWRYSELDQIHAGNVAGLLPAWVFQFGSQAVHVGASTHAFENAPVVVDGVMFVTGWDGYVWALDARTGRQLWQYKHAIPYDVSLCCGNVNRGCAVARGKVFVATLNAHLVALDATTGTVVWDRTNGDVRAGESATVAPLVVKDLVLVGSSGGEFGVRGHLDAYDLATGEHRWRCYTVPRPGEPGAETWPEGGEEWARGGGNTWVTGTFDPETDLVYWGTGNPAPDFDGEVRPGDNLHTDSVIAVDADTGEIRWHYQFTPHDLWDYDSNMEMILFSDGGRKLLAHFDKNGYFFVLDRVDGSLVRVTPFADRIDWGSIAADGTVTPSIFPDKEGEDVHFWPGPAGAKEWTHAAYSPRTHMFYVPVQDVGSTVTRRRVSAEGVAYWDAEVSVDADDMAGQVKAFDASTGEETWRWDHHLPMSASVLATAGDVVFCGSPSGDFHAFDAFTGEVLWMFDTGSGHHSSPSTYAVDGRQYIAVPVGWGSWVEGFAPGMMGGPHGDALFVFALPP